VVTWLPSSVDVTMEELPGRRSNFVCLEVRDMADAAGKTSSEYSYNLQLVSISVKRPSCSYNQQATCNYWHSEDLSDNQPDTLWLHQASLKTTPHQAALSEEQAVPAVLLATTRPAATSQPVWQQFRLYVT
jgi:hypothetical protein